MQHALAEALAELPDLMTSADGWRSLAIDYHPPVVERAWRPWRDGYRLAIHRIHACAPGEALLHPHPWPSAMHILDGRYEMGLGHGAGVVPPPIAARLIMPAGSSYEMTDIDAWHFVRPLDRPALTVMLTGQPWAREMPVEPNAPLRELSPPALAQLLADARRAL